MALALALGSLACADVLVVAPAPSGAEGVSLLGDTLWTVPIAPEEGQRIVPLLQQARADLAQHRDDPTHQVRVGYHTARLGRLREAVELYSRGASRHPDDPRFYRHRGEALLALRQFDLAIADLTRASRLAVFDGDLARLTEVAEGQSGPVGSLHFNIHFLLGVARHCKGQYVEARAAFQQAFGHASVPDEFVHAAVWYYLTVRQLGDTAEAASALRLVPEAFRVVRRQFEHRLLLALRDGQGLEAFVAGGTPVPAESRALLAYLQAVEHLRNGRPSEAVRHLVDARTQRDWRVLSAVAAEAALARNPAATLLSRGQ